MKKEDFKIGQKISFHTGNFSGLTGVFTKIDWKNKDSLFGYQHTVMLSNSSIGYVEKTEHFTFLK